MNAEQLAETFYHQSNPSYVGNKDRIAYSANHLRVFDLDDMNNTVGYFICAWDVVDDFQWWCMVNELGYEEVSLPIFIDRQSLHTLIDYKQ